MTQLRGRTALADYRGLAHARPWLATVLALALLSLAGLPPLAGFAGKLMLFVTTLDAGHTVLAVAALVNTVISLYYYLRVLAPMVFDAAPSASIEVLGRGPALAVAAGGIALLAIGFGAGALLSALAVPALLP